jgi:kynurenine formamidase
MSLKIYNLSQPFGHHMPEWPSSPGVNVLVDKFHAKDGVYQVEWDGIMHRGTHMDAPVHVTENTPAIMDYPLWRLFGTGVAVSIPKGKWGVITPDDLEKATPVIQEGDIVMINTGMHHKFADTDEYFAYGCGINGAGAQWMVDKKVKMVGYGCQANDHPVATKLFNHGLGPSQPHLIEEYKEMFGTDPKDDFPDWEPAHKTLMVKGGIPGIENVGGDLDEVTGKRCTFMAIPWRWKSGDGCVVRVLALIDPDQSFRFETGE